mmetsp:Transcript_46855/g.111506  ORF Transcript_46855/g.111506 Transcript_46855/m.111506 type:complete len:807 (+) Transcript_46855:128-2548(+)
MRTVAQKELLAEGLVGRYKVVFKNVAVRSSPSVKAGILYVAKHGMLLEGSVHVVDGNPWLSLSADTRLQCQIPTQDAEAWVLIHGECVGLGDLLRPVNEEVECLEELLTRIGGGEEGADRVRPLVEAVHSMGLRLGSQLLAATDTELSLEGLQSTVAAKAAAQRCEVPVRFASYLRKAVEDSRLGMGGFPAAPPNTKVQIVFTAPHSLPLCREGHRPHQPEAYTSSLARDFAKAVGGAFLTWSRLEESRAREHYKVTGSPDPTNTDPNYLRVQDLKESPWTRNLQEVRRLWDPLRPALHVDLHGCQDPSPSTGSDLILGLRAMEFAGRKRTEELRQLLFMTLSMALRGLSINVKPSKQLTGALEDGHCTLSQQSLTDEGGSYTCSVQIEMSRTLRKRLYMDSQVKGFLAQAIKHAWVLFCGEVPEGPPVTHTLGHWALTCKSFYSRVPTLFAPEGTEASLSQNQDMRSTPEPPEAEGDPEDNQEDQLPNNDDDERGEVTANSEARAAPHGGDFGAVETQLTKMARTLHEKSVASGSSQNGSSLAYGGFISSEVHGSASLLTPVTLLRDWLRGTLEDLPALQPRYDFYVLGSWSGWKKQRMAWDGQRFSSPLHFHEGFASFVIQRNGLASSTLYPLEMDADPLIAHGVLGPDDKCNGRKWRMRAGNFSPNGRTGGMTPVRESADYEVLLYVDVDGNPLMVSSKKMLTSDAVSPAGHTNKVATNGSSVQQTSELKVVVYIDRGLGHQLELKLAAGSTVGTVKEEVAKTDPSGATRPDDFYLSSSGKKLDVTIPITSALAELDLCFQGG